MVTSKQHGRIVSHVFSGELELRDLADARTFVEVHLAEDNEPFSVLWDLRGATIEAVDEYYEAISRAVIDPRSTTPEHKRAFLVQAGETEQLVAKVLRGASPPWPWAVFVAEGEALDWLSS